MEAGAIEPMDPVLTARLLGGMFRNAMMEAYVYGDGSDAEAIREAMVLLAVNALRPRSLSANLGRSRRSLVRTADGKVR